MTDQTEQASDAADLAEPLRAPDRCRATGNYVPSEGANPGPDGGDLEARRFVAALLGTPPSTSP